VFRPLRHYSSTLFRSWFVLDQVRFSGVSLLCRRFWDWAAPPPGLWVRVRSRTERASGAAPDRWPRRRARRRSLPRTPQSRAGALEDGERRCLDRREATAALGAGAAAPDRDAVIGLAGVDDTGVRVPAERAVHCGPPFACFALVVSDRLWIVDNLCHNLWRKL